MSTIFWPQLSKTPGIIGAKASALFFLSGAEWLVPDWFAITPEAFEASCHVADWQTLPSGADSRSLEFVVGNVVLSPTMSSQIQRALAQLCPHGEAVAVRSSAFDEDGENTSFAGQYQSWLGVEHDEVCDRITGIWKSALSARVRRYRELQGRGAALRLPAVLIQRMVHADIAGVAFSADPVTGQRGVTVVSATYGLGTSLVDGEGEADTWKLDRRDQIFSQAIAQKRVQHRARRGGIISVSVNETGRNAPALTDEQIRAVAAMARGVARHFGCPQDIEWAIESGRLYLLQARPITTLAALPDPDGPLSIWDNSNITESYSGVTTPLTFTFALRAYEGVYRQFCRLLAVSPAKIAAHQHTFRQMLGLIQGRVYYNLINWYRILALLPGFTINRRFMEQMMGVKEPLPTEVVEDLQQAHLGERLRDGFRLGLMCMVIVRHFIWLPRKVRSFQERLNTALLPPVVPLERMWAEELVSYFHELERKLLTRWDAPLLNDFFTMIFCGMLRRLSAAWCGDKDGTLVPALLCGQSEVISAEPPKRMRELARLVAGDAELVDLFCEGGLCQIRLALKRLPPLELAVQSYLRQFGDRCPDELKLESLTLHDDPLPFFRAVGRLAPGYQAAQKRRDAQMLPDREARPLDSPESSSGLEAEREVLQRLASHPVRQALFGWILRQARARVRDRENLRFERTRLFARVRQIVVELGKRLANDGHLNRARDVFYLQLDELLGFVAGTSSTADLSGLTAARRVEFERYRQIQAVPNRIVTRGSPYHRVPSSPQDMQDVSAAETRQGQGCSPGRVRGQVQVILDPWTAQVRPGAILVARHTDPGWVLLFPSARGLLVERGSLLSHSAIVARELKIPAIVGLEGVVDWLKDDEWVEMDGAAGLVRRIPALREGEATTALSIEPPLPADTVEAEAYSTQTHTCPC